MKSELDAKTLATLRAELQDLLESAYAAGSDEGESDLIKMLYSGKADACETALSLINVALEGDPDETEIRRIRWSRIGAVLCVALAATETELVEYQETVSEGDTLWGIVGKVATNKDDMGKLMWQVMQDNKIEDPGNLQPGTVIVIRVKEARAL